MSDILNRKGAPKTADVPAEVRRLLDSGQIETVNLTEWLVVNHDQLAHHVLPDLGLDHALPLVQARFKTLGRASARQAAQEVASALLEATADQTGAGEITQRLAAHRSDSVRCWGAYVVGLDSRYPVNGKLRRIRPFAVDSHFGVREVAWMAVRPAVADALDEAIGRLTRWAEDEDAYARRFVSEVTRPRGVWCRHIDRLKGEPEMALPLLEPLRCDPSKYVRDSVANWLNDAGKTQPVWVMALCARWQAESPTPETAYIVKRALRTLHRKA